MKGLQMQECDGKHKTLDEIFECEECSGLFDDGFMERKDEDGICRVCNYGDQDFDISEACVDCISDYVDGKQQMEEDNYRDR